MINMIGVIILVSTIAYTIGHYFGCNCGCQSKWKRTIIRFGLQDETKKDV